MRGIKSWGVVATLAAFSGLVAVPPAARAVESGPPLDVPAATLAQALHCPASFTHPEHEVVLLVHGTATNAHDSWEFGYQRTLPDFGFDTCTVDLPELAMADIQTAAEYVVYGVRAIADATGRKVALVGHSQGGLEPRWAVRWWPDVAADVTDIVTLATDNQGTATADASCIVDCAPSIWQQNTTSNFIAALNQQPTVAGIAYTSIYSLFDELIQPAVVNPVAVIPGGSNVLVQDLCPGRPVHHISPIFDAVYWSVMLDALSNDGPADPSRFAITTCAQLTAPGITAAQAAAADATLYANALQTFSAYPHVSAEPPLRDYAQ